jgi:hypothetical protein
VASLTGGSLMTSPECLGMYVLDALPSVHALMQDGANLSSDQSLVELAKVQVQDGSESACHVGGCGKEFG